MSEKAFFNIEEVEDGIHLWTYKSNQTYLCIENYKVHIVQFDNEAAAQKWQDEQEKNDGYYLRIKDHFNVTRYLRESALLKLT